jgi:hypothetical protein
MWLPSPNRVTIDGTPIDVYLHPMTWQANLLDLINNAGSICPWLSFTQIRLGSVRVSAKEGIVVECDGC